MREYKVEIKCSWTAESNRMKAYVQLGLLCLSLLISSLHGQEVERESNKELFIPFEEMDPHQLEAERVRLQTVYTGMETGEEGKRRPRPGRVSVLNGRNDDMDIVYQRSKRQSKNNKRKKAAPGKFSLLTSSGSSKRGFHNTVRVKREDNTGGRRPWPGN